MASEQSLQLGQKGEGVVSYVWLGMLGLVCMGMMFGTSIFQMVVEAPNWSGSLPESARLYANLIKVTNPGHYYKIMNPLSILFFLGVVVLVWRKEGAIRWWSLVAIGTVVLNMLITFIAVYPLNHTLFFSVSSSESIVEAAGRWKMYHALRIAALGAGVYGAVRALLVSVRPLARG